MAGIGAVGGASGGIGSIGASTGFDAGPMEFAAAAAAKAPIGNAQVETSFDASNMMQFDVGTDHGLGAPDVSKRSRDMMADLVSMNQAVSTYKQWCGGS
jgi:hypothetical protein